MSKQLKVVLDDSAYRELKQAARRRGLTLSEWVRRSLADTCAREATTDPSVKLSVVRTAIEHDFPTADMDRMIREIEQGYGSEP
jgi:hypothetical protein